MLRAGSGWVRKCFLNLTGRVGSGQEVFKSRGSGLVLKSYGSGRVGSGQVKNSSNFTGRVRSGQEVMKSSRVGSGHDPRETGHSRVGPA